MLWPVGYGFLSDDARLSRQIEFPFHSSMKLIHIVFSFTPELNKVFMSREREMAERRQW